MYLKSLTLKGFKSFAARTHMVFDPGLSVVVGPNGSGKSNVSDAILWVLGEQSAKQLRGQAMEDVIFSGSSARGPAGLAEVTLVLDNSDGTLPVDFEEVGVTRRMYRSGESEYLINGAPARLMDVQDILHDSGLGKETHSIISQGKLDAVLQAKPEQRRELIEEAAGISKHRRRKERAARKLKSMDENVRRARDLDREIKRQLRPLERQVDKAQRYNDLEARRGLAATQLAVDDLRRLQAEWEAVKAERTEAEAAVELADYRAEDRAENLEKLQALLEQKGLFVGDLGEQRRRVQDKLGRLESDMRLLEEKGRNMVSKLSETRMSLSSLERQRRDAAQELEASETELEAVRARQGTLRSSLAELGPAADEAAAALRALRERSAAVSAEARAAQRDRDDAFLAQAKLRERLSHAEVEDDLFAGRIRALQESQATDAEALTSARARLADAEHGVADARKALDAASKAVEEASRSQREHRQQEDAATRALREAEAELKALRSVDASVGPSGALAKALLKQDGGLVRGTLADALVADLANAPEGADALVERLLGSELRALVPAEGDGRALVDAAWRRRTAGGAVTILDAAEGAEGSVASHGPGEALLDRLRCDDPSPLARALFGSVRVVATAEEAAAAAHTAPDVTFITEDGLAVARGASTTVGVEAGSDEGVLERKRRVTNLERRVPQMEEALESARATSRAANDAVRDARDARERARSSLNRLNAEVDAARRETGRLEGAVSRGASEVAALEKKRAQAAQRMEEARPQLAELRAKEEKAAKRSQALAVETEELEAARSEAERTESQARQAASACKLELATVTERRRHLEVRCEELRRSIDTFDKRVQSAVESTRALEVLRLRVDPLHDRYDALHERLLEWAARLRDRASLAEADSQDLKKTINDARAEATEAKQALDRATSRLNESNVKAGRLEERVRTAVDAVRACDAMPLEEALKLPEPEDRGALEREVAKLERDIKAIGPVNQVAMEEYQRLKERADHIAASLADLEGARKSLDKIQSAIDRKMRAAFVATFDAVNENFREVFQMLFPGGTGHLEMTDPDHPGETGIEVFVQPQGKKVPKLALLSGGERSLVALALLFAVYRTRTVPFYVFDEVEAALDDSNLDKLLAAIERLKEETQLIVISHQRRTMEQADVLWGVSMHADGVSQVVSQRLDRATGKVVDV